ncbi:class I SAM-dependent methyltransferase [Luteibacter aegosomatis]|uniref:class I SAM-dependent methyltransferase n=1 Tax=Luteibacter aegosomatis TaxID=2911537 RepID=UPI001FF8359F|nr:class I SAM-dependent methyltransferase [Luteibacter aegosomatis]UPG85152.1 class I SAM-dependent methyltransferase [Luteibacter aegosomatis]
MHAATPVLDPVPAYALWAASYPAHAHNPLMHAEERAMLAAMPSSLEGMAVVDAGCGSGRYLRHVLARGATSATGVDLSPAMLHRAEEWIRPDQRERLTLVQGSITALPLDDGVADVTVCGLVVGHVPDLDAALAELCRVTKPGGEILCSDFHPVGQALGWRRDFRADGRRYAVRHTTHAYSRWHDACARLGLAMEGVFEPMLDPADIPPGARFDPVALEVPVALVFRLRRSFLSRHCA